MDGVIVNSEFHWASLETRYYRERGFADGDISQQIVGLSPIDAYLVLRRHGLCIARDQFLKDFDRLAEKVYKDLCDLLPDLYETISALHQTGYIVALCSSSPKSWINMVLDRFDLRKFLSIVVSAQDCDDIGKPHPAVYEEVLRQAKCEPYEALAVEDSENGIRSAQAAGLTAIGLLNGHNTETQLMATPHRIACLSELDSWL